MTEAQRFPGRLRELREQAGLTQQQLAERVGVTWEAVSRWERGTREPSWSNVVALVKALGVDANAFLQEPTTAPPAGPGRPRKPTAESADQQPKRPRGRPRKAPAVSEEVTSEGNATEGLAGQKKTANGKGRKDKGRK